MMTPTAADAGQPSDWDARNLEGHGDEQARQAAGPSRSGLPAPGGLERARFPRSSQHSLRGRCFGIPARGIGGPGVKGAPSPAGRGSPSPLGR